MTISDSIIISNLPAANKKINWAKFKQALLRKYPKQIAKLTNSSEIYNEVLLITSDIQSAIAKCSYSVNQIQVSRPLPTKNLQKITIKRILRKDWQCSRGPTVKSILNAQI